MKCVSVVPHFWKWFKLHNSRFLRIFQLASKTAFNYQFNELQVHVRAYCKWLSADLIINAEMTEATLIITANGNVNGFKKAEKLVAKAPVIPGWTIYALRPPGTLESFSHPVQKLVDIEPGNCWFRYAGKCFGGASSIEIYIDWILPGKENDTYDYVDLLIEHLLGERASVEDIEIACYKQRCEASRGARLRKLEELPALILGKSTSVSIGPGGQIEGLL